MQLANFNIYLMKRLYLCHTTVTTRKSLKSLYRLFGRENVRLLLRNEGPAEHEKKSEVHPAEKVE